MNMKNETFDKLKWISMILIPALVTLVLAVGQIWSLPYYEKIGATIAAFGVFLGALLKVSTSAYNKINDEIAVGEAIEEDGDQGEIPIENEEEAKDESFEP